MATEVSVDLQVVGLPEEEPVTYELVFEKLYEPEASTYVGKAEEVTIFFDGIPEQIPGQFNIITGTVTAAVVENILANDGTMLRLQIYRGTGQWYNSKWKVVFAMHSSPFPWAVVIPLIIALLIVIGFIYITHQVKELDWPGKAIMGLGLAIVLILLLLALGAGGKKVFEKKKEAK